MIKKLLTRLLVLATIGLMGYFVFLTRDQQAPRIERPPEHRDESAGPLLGQGEETRYTRYDADGNLIMDGTSDKTVQTGEEGFVLEGVSFNYRRDGRAFSVVAAKMVTEDGGRAVMSADAADPDDEIVLVEENGIRIETRGPLYQDPDGTIHTEAVADFFLEKSRGSCKGLRYRSESFLELKKDVVFVDRTDEAVTDIEAAYLMVEDLTRTGLIRDGVITTRDARGTNLLVAERIDVQFRRPLHEGDLSMDRAVLSGAPATVVWHRGDLSASHFEICFDASGRWAEEMVTGSDAQFGTETNDGFDFTGRSGRLVLRLSRSVPRLLRGQEPIRIDGRRAGDDRKIALSGKEGLETEFLDGAISSTRIFGEPVFAYGDTVGSAGNLRVLHSQHQILFSGGAELEEKAQGVKVQGDEVLLTNWDERDKEIFAFDFVEIHYARPGATPIDGYGDKLELHLPRNYVKLEGEPARFKRAEETIEAAIIEVTEIDREVFDLVTDVDVVVTKVTREGTYWIEARKMTYGGRQRVLRFEGVREAILPDRGRLSCDEMEIWLKPFRAEESVDKMEARGNVFFRHVVVDEDGEQPVTCQADILTLNVPANEAIFKGVDKDVVITQGASSSRMRELIYDLDDGSVTAYAEKQGRTQTTVPIKQNRKPPR